MRNRKGEEREGREEWKGGREKGEEREEMKKGEEREEKRRKGRAE